MAVVKPSGMGIKRTLVYLGLLFTCQIPRVNSQCPDSATTDTDVPNSMNDITTTLAEGTMATITCLAGFEPTAPTTVTCAMGTPDAWMPAVICTDIDECAVECVGADGCLAGAPGSFLCVCADGYTWDGTTCAASDCGVPGDFHHAYYDPANITGSVLALTEIPVYCDDGWHISDGVYETLIACNAGPLAGWTEPDPCVDIDECADPATCGTDGICVNTPGAFYCLCPAGADWDGDLLTGSCLVAVDVDECAADPDLCRPDGICVNTIGSYYCVCSSTATWSGDLIAGFCTPDPVDCGDPPIDMYAHHAPSATRSTLAGANPIMYECDTGFHLDGEATSSVRYTWTCEDDGTWSGGGTCVDIDECDDVVGGVCTQPNQNCRNYPGWYQCDCKEGYEWTDRETALSQPFGGECLPVDCGDHPNIQYTFGGEGEGEGNTYGKEVRYRCQPGYRPSSYLSEDEYGITLTCTAESRWEAVKTPFCTRISCGHPGVKAHSQMSESGFLYEDRVRYICDEGYTSVSSGQPDGEIVRTCEEDGEWSFSTDCEDIDECAANPGICGTDAHTCINTPGSYQCSCDFGYRRAGNGQCVEIPLVRLGENSLVSAGCELFNNMGLCGGHTCTYTLDGRPTCQCSNGYNGPFCTPATNNIPMILAITALVLFLLISAVLFLLCCGMFNRPRIPVPPVSRPVVAEVRRRPLYTRGSFSKHPRGPLGGFDF